MNREDDSTTTMDENIIAIMGGISIGFKRINTIWLFSPKTYMIRKFDYIDPNAIVEFNHVANFIKPNNRKDEITYLNTYLNNLMNQILREDSLSNESLEISIKSFLKKKMTNSKLPNMEIKSKKLNLEIIFKNYQTKMVEFLKKLSNLIMEELNQLKRNIPNIVKSPTCNLKYLFPIPRERHGMCKIPNSKYLLIFGGIADKKIRLNDVWFLNLETMMWHEGKLKGFYSSSINGNTPSINSEEYDLYKDSQTSTWIPTFSDSHNFMVKDGFTMNLGIKIPTPRYHISITPINGNLILLFGGYDGTFRNDMWMLNILDFNNFIFEWKKVDYNISNNGNDNTKNGNIPLPRYNYWCGLVKDKILLFGGVLEKGIQTNDLWLFDFDSYKWKNLLPDKDPSDDYPERRSDHRCVIIGKFLIVVGGVYKKLYLKNIFILDLETLQWKKFNNEINSITNENINNNTNTSDSNIDNAVNSINNNNISINSNNELKRNLPSRIGFIIQPISNCKAFIFGGIVDKDKLVARANDMWLLETNLNETSFFTDLGKVSFLNETRVGNYVIERLLGRGGQACVFLVRDDSTSSSIYGNTNNGNVTSINKYYALKRMDIVFNDNVGRNKSVASDSVFNEILILQQLKHVNILPTLSFFIEKRQNTSINSNINDNNNDNSNMISLVLNIIMPYCESGDLSIFYVRKVNYWKKVGNFNELEIIEYLIQIILALEYIHDRNIIHRDLKPSNIFVTFENQIPIMKLSDFGLAKNVQSSLARTACGTMLYLAPEIYNEDSYSEKVDIWSFGCIIAFMLLNGQLKIDLKIPTNKKKLIDSINSNQNVMKLIGKDEYLQLIFDCIENEPENRPTAKMIVKKLMNLKENVTISLQDKLQLIKNNAMSDNNNNLNNLNNTTKNDITNNNNTIVNNNNIDQNTSTINEDQTNNNNNSENSENSNISISDNNNEELKNDNEHEVFEIVNSEEELTQNISQTSIINNIKLEQELKQDEEEEIWIEIQSILFKLEKEEFLTEEQVDTLSFHVMNNHVGMRRFYLAVVKNCGGGETVSNNDNLEFKEEITKQFKRLLRILNNSSK